MVSCLSENIITAPY